MPDDLERVLIIANLDKDDARGFALEVETRLVAKGIRACTFAFTGDPGAPPPVSGRELVISLGGDGTVLYAARVAAPFGIPVFPVNLGRLGFIAEIRKADWERSFDEWLAGRLPVSQRVMLSVEAWRDGVLAASFVALNDGVVSGQGIAKVIGLGIRVGESFLGRYRSDGVIVATPTGSTAYNIAAGGPALHPEMEAMVLNPVCPFTLSNRPLIVPATETIEVLVEEGRRTEVILTVDGQETFPLHPGDRVRFTRAPFKALILASDRMTFYEVLRAKLAWSGGPDA